MDKNTWSTFTLSIRDSLHIQRHRQIASKRMEKNSMQITQNSRGGYTHIRQNSFTSEKFRRDKEGHYMLIKSLIHQEDVTIVNIYTHNDRSAKFI